MAQDLGAEEELQMKVLGRRRMCRCRLSHRSQYLGCWSWNRSWSLSLMPSLRVRLLHEEEIHPSRQYVELSFLAN